MVTMLPVQVSEQWDMLRPVIQKSLPVRPFEDQNRMANILTSILGGRLSVHIFGFPQETGKVIPAAIVTTGKVIDVDSIYEDLLIVSATGIGKMEMGDLTAGINLLMTYAKGLGCRNLVMYTEVAGIKKLLERAGGRTGQTLVVLPVKEV
jgi:hypothetical protein